MNVSQKPKNVILVSFDDAVAYWHYREVFGVTLQTPNLDRICAQSTAFKSAYCQSPVCGPSRASFMSGKTPHQSGCFENATKFYDKIEPRDMWPYLLKQQGYFCSSGGKVHHGYKPLPKETYEALYSDPPKKLGIIGKLPPKHAHVKLGGWRGGYALTDPADDDVLYDAQSAASAIDFLENYEGDAPFYREVGFFSPHGPFITPLRFKQLYPFKDIKQPADWANGFDKNAYADEHMQETMDNTKINFWRKSVRNYLSAISHLDYQVGRVWDALKASKHADDTVVIFTADHGFHLGERNRFRKTTLWEQIANVPLIVHDPDLKQGDAVSDPVALLDVGATALDYAGLPAQKGCVGRSLRPYLSGETDPSRAVPTFQHDNAAIRKGKYRLIRYEDGSTQFYDLEADPWQTTDLGAEHADYAAMYDALVAICAEYGLSINAA